MEDAPQPSFAELLAEVAALRERVAELEASGPAGDPLAAQGIGRDRWFGTELGPVVVDGEGTGLTQEIADRRRLEERIVEAEKLESLATFAGGVAHDFNNLLAIILTSAELALLSLPGGTGEARLVNHIVTAAKRAAGLTGKLLAYSGKGHFRTEPLDLNHLVAGLGPELTAAAGASRVIWRLTDALPTVRGDAGQLRQLIAALVANAVEANPEGGAEVRVATGIDTYDRDALARLQPHVALAPGDYVWVEVSDAGEGLTEDVRSRMFDPFFTTRPAGRGLGLAAVHGIVRGHKGAIAVDSAPGDGTTIRVLLPALAAAIRAEPTAPGEAREPWRGSGTILLVDDMPLVRDVARLNLERLGFAVVPAGSGAEAIELYAARHGDLACVLLDLRMPELDGAETYAELRKLATDVPVVLCSGYTEAQSTEQFAGKGLAGFLQKPYTIETLRETLRTALGSP